MRMYSTSASARATISSSGANIRFAFQVPLELGGDATQSHRLLQALGHRPFPIPPAILRPRRLVSADPPTHGLALGHTSIVTGRLRSASGAPASPPNPSQIRCTPRDLWCETARNGQASVPREDTRR